MLEKTVAEVFEDYVAVRRPKDSTVDCYRKALRYTVPDWLNRPLATISKHDILARHKLRGAEAAGTTTICFRVLRGLFNFAAVYYDGPDGRPLFDKPNPVKILSATKTWHPDVRRTNRLSPDDLRVLLSYLPDHRNPAQRDFIFLLLFTGLRKEEARQLKWNQIDFPGRAIRRIALKQGTMLDIPMSDAIYRLLRRRYNRGDRLSKGAYTSKTEGDFVFAGPTGRPVTAGNNLYNSIGTKTGVKFCFHDLRRTFLCTALVAGVPEIICKMLVGHCQPGNMTARYSALAVSELQPYTQAVTEEILRQAGKLETEKAV
ncbi:MAG: tyrosine-type recombinase/integrase [Cyanobacteria bacterium SZAS LIN-3]|nr:tyrosine-type recombinase/integrase [Cyanobacteria bacterium SZAS LIN-3]